MSNARSALLVAVLLSVAIAACTSGAGGPIASPSPTSPPPSGGGQDATPPASADEPIGGVPNPVPGDPNQPKLVVPRPGQQNVHPVAIEEITARVDGRHVVLNARWTSGIDPCYVLDSVAWKRDGQDIVVSAREGTGGGDVICIEIAVLKVTVIDLGELPAGVYTIRPDEGPAAAITVTVG